MSVLCLERCDAMTDIFTTRTGARVLGIKQDTLKHYAIKFGVGYQPGGVGTPWLFTLDDLRAIRKRDKWDDIDLKEDLDVLNQ